MHIVFVCLFLIKLSQIKKIQFDIQNKSQLTLLLAAHTLCFPYRTPFDPEFPSLNHSGTPSNDIALFFFRFPCTSLNLNIWLYVSCAIQSPSNVATKQKCSLMVCMRALPNFEVMFAPGPIHRAQHKTLADARPCPCDRVYKSSVARPPLKVLFVTTSIRLGREHITFCSIINR